MTWTELRDLTAPQAVEGRSAPADGAFVALTDRQAFAVDGRVQYVELRFDALTLAGTVAASAVTFGVWRLSDGKKDRVAAITIASADVGSAPPVVVDAHAEQFAVVVESFVGGTAPTVAGKVYARPVRAMERRSSNPGGPAPVTERSATTPTRADGERGLLEVSRRGVAFVGASLRCWRKLPLATAAGGLTGFASLSEGPCDALRADTDGLIVYAQPPERDPIVSQSASHWTAGAGWSIANGVATHAGGGGTATLSQDTATSHSADPLLATEYYAVIFTISGRTAGTVTPKLGTTAGTARSADGTYIEILQSQASSISFTPTSDFDGSIALASVWAVPGTLPFSAHVWEPQSAIKVVTCALGTSPGTISSTAKVAAGWYRRAGATELT